MKNFGISLAIFLLFVVLGGFYNFLAKDNQPDLKEIQINDLLFKAEVADTPAERIKGLSGRAALPDSHGMLFMFSAPGNYGFWMNGMLIPLDIIWINGSRIAGVEKNISPSSVLNYYPPEPVDKVLEINAGLADKLGIKAGDKVKLD